MRLSAPRRRLLGFESSARPLAASPDARSSVGDCGVALSCFGSAGGKCLMRSGEEGKILPLLLGEGQSDRVDARIPF